MHLVADQAIEWTIRWWEGSNLPRAQESKAGLDGQTSPGSIGRAGNRCEVPRVRCVAVAGETGKTDAVHHLCYGPLAPGSCVKKPAALVWVKVELLDGDHRGPLAIGRFDRAAILALAADDDDAPAPEIGGPSGRGTPGSLRIRTSYQLAVRTRQWDIMLRMCRPR
jgi:hypothetical protein